MARMFYASLAVGLVAVIACTSKSTDDGSSAPSDTDASMPSGDVDGGGTTPESGPPSVDSSVPPLACDARTWCTTYNVKIFRGTVPAAAGGTVVDGTYRLAYSLEPADVDPDGTTDYPALFTVAGPNFLSEDDTGSGVTGTYATAGTSFTTTGATSCSSFGVQGAADTHAFTEPYTATGTTLTFFETVTPLGPDAGAPWTKAMVYTKVTGSLCDQGAQNPTSPGDSFYCRVSNCSCAEATGKVLAAGECPFVH